MSAGLFVRCTHVTNVTQWASDHEPWRFLAGPHHGWPSIHKYAASPVSPCDDKQRYVLTWKVTTYLCLPLVQLHSAKTAITKLLPNSGEMPGKPSKQWFDINSTFDLSGDAQVNSSNCSLEKWAVTAVCLCGAKQKLLLFGIVRLHRRLLAKNTSQSQTPRTSNMSERDIVPPRSSTSQQQAWSQKSLFSSFQPNFIRKFTSRPDSGLAMALWWPCKEGFVCQSPSYDRTWSFANYFHVPRHRGNGFSKRFQSGSY